MPDTPSEIRRLTTGLTAVAVAIGKSGSTVTRLEADGIPKLFLKSAFRKRARDGLVEEADRLRWLRGRIEVPEIVKAVVRDDSAWLLTAALPGHDATAEMATRAPERVVALLATGMRRWHEIPADSCPFDHSPESDLRRAMLRIEAGLIDETDFDAERVGSHAPKLYSDLKVMLPLPGYRSVVTHGDFTLPNVIFNDGQVSGYVDVGRAGVSDRYKDLAICARSISRNLGDEYVGLLFSEYTGEGREALPDSTKLEFFTILDELF